MIARTRLAAATAAIGLLALAAASDGVRAQAPGSVQVGGNVPSVLALSVTHTPGLTSFPALAAPHTYSVTLTATVTATDAGASLRVGDGQSAGGPEHGHLVAGAGAAVLRAPLEVAAGGQPPQSLAGVPDPLVASFGRPVAGAVAHLRLTQAVAPGPARRGPFTKLVLVSAGAAAP